MPIKIIMLVQAVTHGRVMVAGLGHLSTTAGMPNLQDSLIVVVAIVIAVHDVKVVLLTMIAVFLAQVATGAIVRRLVLVLLLALVRLEAVAVRRQAVVSVREGQGNIFRQRKSGNPRSCRFFGF